MTMIESRSQTALTGMGRLQSTPLIKRSLVDALTYFGAVHRERRPLKRQAEKAEAPQGYEKALLERDNKLALFEKQIKKMRIELETEKRRRKYLEADLSEFGGKLRRSRGIIKQLQVSHPCIPRYMPTDSEYHTAYESDQAL